jgi:hypothetical protein
VARSLCGAVREGITSPPSRAVTGGSAGAWGLGALGATGVVAVTAVAAAMGVLPGEAAPRDALHAISSYELRTLARAIRPLGTWVNRVGGLVGSSSDLRRGAECD